MPPAPHQRAGDTWRRPPRHRSSASAACPCSRGSASPLQVSRGQAVTAAALLLGSSSIVLPKQCRHIKPTPQTGRPPPLLVPLVPTGGFTGGAANASKKIFL